MTLLAQHGWGKSDKIDRGIASGTLSGVILSPRDESPTNLAAYAQALREDNRDLTVFVDPQFYATTVTNPRAGRLPDYPYFTAEMTYRDFVGATPISQIVRSVIDHQIALRVSHICAPVVAFDSFGDRWNSVALSMAAEAITYYATVDDDRPLLVSQVINENAFRSNPEFEEYLNIVTDFDCDGFYILLRRTDSGYRQNMESNLLSAMLYMTHVLRTLNEFDVYLGYMDFLGIPMHAAGATGTACGWSLGLRRFTFARFEQSSGGRPPRDRYSSLPLLNSIFVNPELDNIERADMLGDVLTGTAHDGALNTRPPSRSPWPPDVAALHHWETLTTGIRQVSAVANPRDRLDQMIAMVTSSSKLYERLSRAGQRLDGPSGPSHLNQWGRAIDDFRDKAGV